MPLAPLLYIETKVQIAQCHPDCQVPDPKGIARQRLSLLLQRMQTGPQLQSPQLQMRRALPLRRAEPFAQRGQAHIQHAVAQSMPAERGEIRATLDGDQLRTNMQGIEISDEHERIIKNPPILQLQRRN